jgi:hypothetical protein
MAKHTPGACVRVKTRYFEKFKINISTLCRIQTKLSTWKRLNRRNILPVAAPGLTMGGGGIWGANSYFGWQDCHAVVHRTFVPPPGDSPPCQKGAIFLGIPPPGDEYPRNIAHPRGANAPVISPSPLGYSPPIYAMWFIQIISWYFHLISALKPIQTGRYLATRREFSVFNDI